MPEFEVKERTFKTCQMNAFKQLHVARRLLPILAKIPEMLGLTVEECMTKASAFADSPADLLKNINLEVIAETLSGIPDAELEYVLNTCLDSAKVKNPKGTGWAPIRNKGELMYQDLGIREMIIIAAHVIKENLSDFFDGNAPTFLEPAAKAE